MKLNDLINTLLTLRADLALHAGKDYDDESVGDDVEVRIASQPTWPLAHNIESIMAEAECRDKGREGPVLWIGASSSVGYEEHPYAHARCWDDGRLVDADEDEDDE